MTSCFVLAKSSLVAQYFNRSQINIYHLTDKIKSYEAFCRNLLSLILSGCSCGNVLRVHVNSNVDVSGGIYRNETKDASFDS